MTLTNDPGTQHTPGLSQANWTCGHPDHTPSTLTSHLGEPSFAISLLSPLSPPDLSFFTDNQSDALQPSGGSCQAPNSTFYDPPLSPLPAPHGTGLCPYVTATLPSFGTSPQLLHTLSSLLESGACFFSRQGPSHPSWFGSEVPTSDRPLC